MTRFMCHTYCVFRSINFFNFLHRASGCRKNFDHKANEKEREETSPRGDSPLEDQPALLMEEPQTPSSSSLLTVIATTFFTFYFLQLFTDFGEYWKSGLDTAFYCEEKAQTFMWMLSLLCVHFVRKKHSLNWTRQKMNLKLLSLKQHPAL